MNPLLGLFWGALGGLVVIALADVVIATATLPEEWFASCTSTWRCRMRAWRQGLQKTSAHWRTAAAWRRPHLWLTVALMAALGYGLAQTPTSWGFAPLLLSATYFALVAVVDAETHLVPYEEAFLGWMLGLSVGLPRHGGLNTLLGVLGGIFLMGLLYWIGERYTRWKARRHGEEPPEEPALGFGDVYLSGVLGAFLGWPGVLGALMLGTLFMGGFIFLLGLMVLVRQGNLRGFGDRFLPMGPFLVLGAFWLMVTA